MLSFPREPTKGKGNSLDKTAAPSRFLLLTCYLGFVSLGLPDTLIGVAWPSIRTTFGLQQSDISWIFFGGGCSYFVSSFFAGRLLKIFNVGILLAASSALVALAALDYSTARAWTLFALGSLLHGLGSGAIDTGLNHYVANHFSARHMNWLHASYSIGAMIGPVLMTWAITSRNSFRLGYGIVAISLLVLAVLFVATKNRWNDSSPAKPDGEMPAAVQVTPALPQVSSEATDLTAATVLRIPLVWMHIFLFFIYTGLEVAIGQWTFTILTESRSIPPDTAGFWVTLYWAFILTGRIVFGFVLDRFGIDRLIRASLFTALLGTGLFVRFPPFSAIALALSGLGLAIIFPCLMTRTPQRFGKAVSAHAIGFQVGAAMLGAAALPSLCGFIAQRISLASVPIALFAMATTLFLLHELVLRVPESGASLCLKQKRACESADRS